MRIEEIEVAYLTVLGIWISTERRRLVQGVPDPMRKVWDKWHLRGPVLTSLVCQLILLVYGQYRKNVYSCSLNSLVWAANLMLDWVANFALGVISSMLGEPDGKYENDQVLIAFWGTFLLVHLGGPSGFTAQALEDNAEWHRALVLWLVQTIRVLYLIFMSWRSTWFSYFSIAMLVVGFINFGERTWALYSASIDTRKDLKESHKSSLERTMNESENDSESNPRVLFEDFRGFFVSLFVDLVFTSNDLLRKQSYFRKLSAKRAFVEVEQQLNYAFDVFYTKAYVMFSPLGRILDACAVCITMTVFTCFCIAKENEMHGLSKVDKIITWSLMVGVLLQGLDTVGHHVHSYWNSLPRRYSQHMRDQDRKTFDEYNFTLPKVINKYNLLILCMEFKDRPRRFKMILKMVSYLQRLEVKENLRENIFKHFLNKSETDTEGIYTSKCGVLCAIKAWGLMSIEWTKMLEFHQSILTWHIATELCYQIDDIDKLSTKVRNSGDLSGYMLYLLITQRHMLPIGRGVITFRETCADTIEFFQQINGEITPREVCNKLLQLINPDAGRGSRSHSALLDGCRLARSLILEMETGQRWEFLEAVWMEILGYAAIHCRVDQHAQQLRKGGEFLTHVWLLMARLGVMEQFQVTRTPANPSEEQFMDHVNSNESLNGNADRRPEDEICEIIEEEHIP